MKTTLAVAAAALCLALAGCGGDGGGSDNADEEKAAANLKTFFLEESEDAAGLDVTEEQAGCVSDGVVSEIGIEQLQDYGLLTDDLEVEKDADIDEQDITAEDADSLAGTFVDCVDVKALITEQMGELPGATAEQKKCISDALTDEALTDMLSQVFQGNEDEATSQLQSEMMGCVTPSAG
jgi:hypothetical protein